MERGRATTGAAVWTLSVLLAAIFVAAGVPKIVGIETPLIQAGAMHGFPSWMRVVVGVCEVAGAVALLIPSLAIYGAIGLGILMIPASITQAMSAQPNLMVIPFALLLLLGVVGWLRDQETMRSLYKGIAGRGGPVVREGLIAGFIGATSVAIWFLIVDIISGHPLFTPTTLGHAFFSLFRPTAGTPALISVIGYTVIHYSAFMIVGVIAADVIAWAGREPAVLFGFGILFVAFEVGFYGFVALLQQASPLGTLAWSNVMLGNLISAAAMGGYLWQAHPRLHEQLAHAFD